MNINKEEWLTIIAKLVEDEFINYKGDSYLSTKCLVA